MAKHLVVSGGFFALCNTCKTEHLTNIPRGSLNTLGRLLYYELGIYKDQHYKNISI